MTKKSEKDWDKAKLESWRAEAEGHLGEPMLLTEYTEGQIELATEASEACTSPTSDTKECC